MWHFNFDKMVTIRKNKRVRDIPNLSKPEMAICKQCQIGKMSKRSFISESLNFVEVLEMVDTNICGPIIIESYYRDMYFILFFDTILG